MEYENDVVFSYVEQLSQGFLNRNFTISNFAGKHTPIGYKLKELKDIIIRYYPEKNNYQLNQVLLEIILSEQDLTSHCMIEDKLFVPQ
jgi:regulator of cell morphogenesis and NO signaling